MKITIEKAGLQQAPIGYLARPAQRLTDVDAVAVKHGTKLEDAEGCEYRFDAEDLGAFVREILGVKE